jgi:peptidoglycan/xylan/chitin deacetylase (PgdA/CDA1 family)
LLTVRKLARRSLEAVLIAARGVHLGPGLRQDRAFVLAYHNVVPDDLAGSGDASLHIPLSLFRRHLDVIQESCRVVPLRDLLSGEWRGGDRRLAVSFTFDDGYRGTFALALPELGRRKFPATVFIAPGLLGDRTLWWDALSDSRQRAVPAALRRSILEAERGTTAGARRVAAAGGWAWRELPELLRTVTAEELKQMVEKYEVTLGSHTWGHTSLPRVSESTRMTELADARNWLAAHFAEACLDVVSYPYGHCSPEVEAAAAATGHRGGLALEARSLTGSEAEACFRIPRMNVPAGLSTRGITLRLARR